MSRFFKFPVQKLDAQLFIAIAAFILYTSCETVSRNVGMSEMIVVSLML